MSQSESASSSSSNGTDTGRTNREPGKRAFAAEYADATEMFKESDAERAPKFAVLPTGERANRVFVVGTLTEAQDIAKSDDDEYWQARVVDPTGAFYVYAGQYQPEAMNALRGIETPEFVAVVGKPRSWETDDGEIRTSITPESVTVVDQATRNRWVVETAELTMERIDEFQTGGDNPDADRAHEAYGGNMDDYKANVETATASLAGIDLPDGDESESESGSEDENGE
jgi:RPA family protein